MKEMQVRKLSQRDLEKLSAFLDGELDAKETAQVEERLERESVLRDALTELRQTRQLLRALPHMTPPRGFALTPEMVASRKPKFAYPVMKLASALAVAAFVLVTGVDVFVVAKEPAALPFNLAQRSIVEAPAMEADAFDVGESADMADDDAAAPLAEPDDEAYALDAAVEGEGLLQTSIPETEIPMEEVDADQEIPAEPPADTEKAYEGVEDSGETATEDMQHDGTGGAGVAPTVSSSGEGEAIGDEIEERKTDWSIDQVPPIRLLEIGLAILCIVLISTTLLMRTSSR